MNITVLAPLGLVALAALALPILIHLARRIELTTTDFAALRWVSERVRPRRRIRIERPWLLLLRLLLLALLAVLLARPVWLRDGAAANAFVVVAPGVDRDGARSAAAVSGAEWHWLAPGFPPLDAGSSIAADVPLASLLRELDARLPLSTRLTVIVPRQLTGLDGERVRLAHAIDWRIAAGAMPEADPTQADPDVQRLIVRYAKPDETALKYLRATVAAWNARAPDRYALDPASLDAAIPADAHWLVWLGGALSPAATAWIERGGVALVADAKASNGTPLWRDASGNVVARETGRGRGRVIAVTGAWTPKSMPRLLDADFPDRLLRAFSGAAAAPTRATAAAAKPLLDAASTADPPRDPIHAHSEDGALAVLIALLFAIERIVATHRRKQVGA